MFAEVARTKSDVRFRCGRSLFRQTAIHFTVEREPGDVLGVGVIASKCQSTDEVVVRTGSVTDVERTEELRSGCHVATWTSTVANDDGSIAKTHHHDSHTQRQRLYGPCASQGHILVICKSQLLLVLLLCNFLYALHMSMFNKGIYYYAYYTIAVSYTHLTLPTKRIV